MNQSYGGYPSNLGSNYNKFIIAKLPPNKYLVNITIKKQKGDAS